MPYFLAEQNLKLGQAQSLVGAEADHVLLSRRAKAGDTIKVQGPDGKRFLSEIVSMGKRQVILKPLEQVVVPIGPPIKITLFQSVVASGTLDTILQKATELGATEIVLFNSHYTATRLSAEKFQEKCSRYQKVLWEAAKQCERVNIPVLRYLPGLDEMTADAAKLDQIFIFDIAGQKLPVNRQSPIVNCLGLVIGPEGGLSPDELKTLSTLPNAQLVNLGPLLLKADTAAIVSLALAQNLVV